MKNKEQICEGVNHTIHFCSLFFVLCSKFIVPMIKHIVFFRLLDEAEGHTKLENAQIIKDGLLSLRDKVDVLVSEEVGINIPNAKKTDYDICLICEFRTWEDVDTYQNHPEHLKVAGYIAKCRSARAAVDYEF